jgi:hypothetical protein
MISSPRFVAVVCALAAVSALGTVVAAAPASQSDGAGAEANSSIRRFDPIYAWGSHRQTTEIGVTAMRFATVWEWRWNRNGSRRVSASNLLGCTASIQAPHRIKRTSCRATQAGSSRHFHNSTLFELRSCTAGPCIGTGIYHKVADLIEGRPGGGATVRVLSRTKCSLVTLTKEVSDNAGAAKLATRWNSCWTLSGGSVTANSAVNTKCAATSVLPNQLVSSSCSVTRRGETSLLQANALLQPRSCEGDVCHDSGAKRRIVQTIEVRSGGHTKVLKNSITAVG